MLNPLYFIGEAFRSLWQSKLVTFVSTITVGITLFFLTILTLALINLDFWVEKRSGSSAISVYMNHTLTKSEQLECLAKVSDITGGDSLNFITPDSAYSNFISLYGDNLLESVDENPFPASIEIYPNGNKIKGDSIVTRLENIDGVESVVFSGDWFEKLVSFRKKFRIYVLFIGSIILMALFFTIANTIKLTVYAREELVVNMQYVGASSWQIRTPFILEGVLQGIIGSILAYVGVSLIRLFLHGIAIYWADKYLLNILVSFGAFLGWAGSILAVRKFIK